MQLGNAFLFIKPVCASPPALFKRGSQTLALAYLIFAPLPTSRKWAQEHLDRQRSPSAIFLQEYFCALVSLQKNISSFLNYQRTPRAIFLQGKYQRTSGVTRDKAQFFWQKKLYFATASKKVKHLMREVSSQKKSVFITPKVMH